MANDSQSPISADDLRRLSDICMPRAKARMDKVYGTTGDSGSARFVHYTSAEAAFTIIKEKTLWMRNTNVMSDASEVRHGYSLLKQYFKDPAKMTALTSALSKSSPGAAELAIKQFDEKFNDIWYNTYITSISEHADSEDVHGRLSMWRAFGGNSARVAIVFRIPRRPTRPDSVSVLLSPVEYLDETGARALLDEAIESIRAGEEFVRTLPQQAVVLTLFMMLLSNSVCFKRRLS
jgi:hypothetical protein